MTKRQAELLNYIKKYIIEMGYSPSYDEIVDYMKLASKSGAHMLVYALASHGKIKINKSKARGIEVVPDTDLLAVRAGLNQIIDCNSFYDAQLIATVLLRKHFQ